MSPDPWDRAVRELDAGRLWRAKEILQGAVGTSGYEPGLYERYGQVLLRMGDNVEAGKYLFLSRVQNAGYEGAITLFVNRYKLKNSAQPIFTFPVPAHYGRLHTYQSLV